MYIYIFFLLILEDFIDAGKSAFIQMEKISDSQTTWMGVNNFVKKSKLFILTKIISVVKTNVCYFIDSQI